MDNRSEKQKTMIIEVLTAGVITAGSGRGFVVEGSGERLVITAAHCLPFLPPAQSFFGPKERTYGPVSYTHLTLPTKA